MKKICPEINNKKIHLMKCMELNTGVSNDEIRKDRLAKFVGQAIGRNGPGTGKDVPNNNSMPNRIRNNCIRDGTNDFALND